MKCILFYFERDEELQYDGLSMAHHHHKTGSFVLFSLLMDGTGRAC